MDTAQLSLVRQPFDDPDFLFELKHDGFRALAHVWDGHCELISRRRYSYKSFQDLRDNLAKLKVKNAIIDGELVCLDAEGRSIFNELLFRRGCPIFYAFDLLYLNGRDFRQLPLIERKEKLRRLMEKSALLDVICGKCVEGRGIDLFNEVCQRNLGSGSVSIYGWLSLAPFLRAWSIRSCFSVKSLMISLVNAMSFVESISMAACSQRATHRSLLFCT
jgi:ATP-dependent DNA ligase